RYELDLETVEQRPDRRPGHPVAAVDDDLEPGDLVRLHEREDRLGVAVVPVDALVGAAARRLAESALDLLAHLLDAAIARQRERALADELRAGVARRVVRGGADQAAVEPARADDVVTDLGRGLAGVDDVDALGEQAVAVAAGELRRRQAHVVCQGDPQVSCALARELGEDAGEGAADLLGDVAVDLLAVDPANVVGLEDLGVEVHRVLDRRRWQRATALPAAGAPKSRVRSVACLSVLTPGEIRKGIPNTADFDVFDVPAVNPWAAGTAGA